MYIDLGSCFLCPVKFWLVLAGGYFAILWTVSVNIPREKCPQAVIYITHENIGLRTFIYIKCVRTANYCCCRIKPDACQPLPFRMRIALYDENMTGTARVFVHGHRTSVVAALLYVIYILSLTTAVVHDSTRC